MNNIAWTALLILFLVSCGTSSKASKTQIVPELETEQSADEPQQETNTPTDEGATKQTIDLGLTGATSEGGVSVNALDEPKSNENCAPDDAECLKAVAAKYNCPDDDFECLKKAAVDAAKKAGVQLPEQ